MLVAHCHPAMMRLVTSKHLRPKSLAGLSQNRHCHISCCSGPAAQRGGKPQAGAANEGANVVGKSEDFADDGRKGLRHEVVERWEVQQWDGRHASLQRLEATLDKLLVMLDPSILQQRARRAVHLLFIDFRTSLHTEVCGVLPRTGKGGQKYWNQFCCRLQRERRLEGLGLDWECIKLTMYTDGKEWGGPTGASSWGSSKTGRGGARGRGGAAKEDAEAAAYIPNAVLASGNRHLRQIYSWQQQYVARHQVE